MANKRKCRHCQTYTHDFIVVGVMAFCNFDHATSYAYANKSKGAAIKRKAANKVKQEKLEGFKTIRDWAKEAQTAVNLYIRTRDKGKPCISCDKPDTGVRNASHYRSVAACSSLRFNTFNNHASCYSCNCSLSGNLLEYRIRLVKLLGQDRVDWLECQNDIARYSIDYLKRIKKVFSRRARHLQKLRGY